MKFCSVYVPNLRFNFNDEWKIKLLFEIAEFYKGFGLSKSDLTLNGLPCILYGELYTTYMNEIINEVVSKTIVLSKNAFNSKKNDLIIPASGEDPIDIAVARVIPFDNILLGGDLNIIRLHNGYSAGFLSYQLNGVRRFEIAKRAQGKSIVHLHNNDLKTIKIFIPSLQEQMKIAQFLQKLDERIQTQIKIIEDYTCVRNEISNVLFKNLKSPETFITSVADVYQPKTISSDKFNKNGKYPVFGANGIIGYYGKYNHENEQICLTCRGASVGKINLSYQYSWITGNSMVINTDGYNGIEKDFLYHQLLSINFTKYISGSGQPQITRESIERLKIKLPSLKIQKNIVQILDTFDLKISKEKRLLDLLISQKNYLLKNMFC